MSDATSLLLFSDSANKKIKEIGKIIKKDFLSLIFFQLAIMNTVYLIFPLKGYGRNNKFKTNLRNNINLLTDVNYTVE